MNSRNVWGLGGGLLLIGLGVLFLIGQFLPGNAMSYLWPFFLVAVGALFFMGMVAGGKSTGALAIPGSIMTMLGVIFLVQAIFNMWASWAYAWTLLIVAVGIGLTIFSLWSDIAQLRFVGRIVMLVGVGLFFLFGIFFEAIFALAGARSMGGVLWAVLLILAGLFLLFGRGRFLSWVGAGEQAAFNSFVTSFAGPSSPATGAPVVDGQQADFVPAVEWSDGTPGEIRRLVFRSYGDMTIRQGENEALVIHAADSIKPRIQSRLEGGILEIWHQNNWWDWFDFGMGGISIRYELTVRSLESIQISGASNISADRLSAPRITIDHNGMGNLTIGTLETQELVVRLSGLGNLEIHGGQAARQSVEQRGLGSYKAGRLVSQVVNVGLSGLGSVTVNATEQLDARVSGLGSIDYYGSPRVNKSVNGLGSINAR